MQCIGNTAADCRRPHALPSQNPAATRHFVIFSQVLNESADNFAANFPDANLQNNTSEDGDG
jgi:hypothetical protein